MTVEGKRSQVHNEFIKKTCSPITFCRSQRQSLSLPTVRGQLKNFHFTPHQHTHRILDSPQKVPCNFTTIKCQHLYLLIYLKQQRADLDRKQNSRQEQTVFPWAGWWLCDDCWPGHFQSSFRWRRPDNRRLWRHSTAAQSTLSPPRRRPPPARRHSDNAVTDASISPAGLVDRVPSPAPSELAENQLRSACRTWVSPLCHTPLCTVYMHTDEQLLTVNIHHATDYSTSQPLMNQNYIFNYLVTNADLKFPKSCVSYLLHLIQ